MIFVLVISLANLSGRVINFKGCDLFLSLALPWLSRCGYFPQIVGRLWID